MLRAAELFFRTQRMMLHESSVLLGDDEVIGGDQSDAGAVADVDARRHRLMSKSRCSTRRMPSITGTAATSSTWALTSPPDGADRRRLPPVMTRWIAHLLGIDVTIEPLTELREAKLTWYVGLDCDATALGDRLWHGEPLDEEANGRVLGAVPADTLPIRRWCVDDFERRTGLSDHGDDRRRSWCG